MKTTNLIRPDIATLTPYPPLGTAEGLAARLGCAPEAILKLDANENPYGASPRVLAALAALRDVHVYPDPESRALRAALADFTGLPAGFLMAGAGSDELLDLLMRLFLAPGDALLDCPPTFGMYAFGGALQAARVVSAPRRADFSLDVDAIAAAVARHRPKLLFVAAPNNPTGTWLPDADLERLLALPLVVVLDEAYVEFAGDDGVPGMARSRIRRVADHDNLIVLRTFSKLAGLAGLRVGYGAFPRAIITHLWKIKQPYNVSGVASAAALAALSDQEWLNANVARIVAERARFFALLTAIPTLRPIPSCANFILCQSVGRDIATVQSALEQAGILVRYYDSPDLRDYFRITVGKPEQTDKVIAVLRDI